MVDRFERLPGDRPGVGIRLIGNSKGDDDAPGTSLMSAIDLIFFSAEKRLLLSFFLPISSRRRPSSSSIPFATRARSRPAVFGLGPFDALVLPSSVGY